MSGRTLRDDTEAFDGPVPWRAPNNQWIDHDLENLLGFWRTVPEQVAEWPEWDDDSKLDVIHEWPIDRERLRRVIGAAEDGQLNEQQCQAWREVQQLIAQHRTTVEEMVGGPI